MAEKASPNALAERDDGFFGTPFRALHEEMDRMLRAFSTPQMSWLSGAGAANGTLGLRVDVGETDAEIHVKADLPGVPEEDVEVVLEDDVLRIRAEKKSEQSRGDKNWRVVERSSGVFERAIRVPPGIDPVKVSATFDKGVLSISLPKPAAPQAAVRRIAIKPAG